MKIKATLDYMGPMGPGVSIEQDVQRLASESGAIIEVVHVPHAPGMVLHVFGTPAQVLRLLNTPNGWMVDDPEEDAETIFAAFNNAVEVYG